MTRSTNTTVPKAVPLPGDRPFATPDHLEPVAIPGVVAELIRADVAAHGPLPTAEYGPRKAFGYVRPACVATDHSDPRVEALIFAIRSMEVTPGATNPHLSYRGIAEALGLQHDYYADRVTRANEAFDSIKTATGGNSPGQIAQRATRKPQRRACPVCGIPLPLSGECDDGCSS
jgi:hypothetical protein